MSQAVFCVADSEARAERIVRDLRDAGFGEQYISVLFPDADGTRELSDDEAHSKAPEGASTGVGTGALVGGTIGWLSGVGAIAVPGLGALVAAGPILATLSAATAGATVGGLAGALVGYAVPELEAKLYEGKLEDGNFLISVHATSVAQQARAREVVAKNGATDISQR
jgi:hypothetical protein